MGWISAGKSYLLFLTLLPTFSCVQVVAYTNPLTSEEHTNLGYIYERGGKLDLAQEEYKKAIRKDRRNWIAYFNLGNVYARKELWERAEEMYLKALRVKKDADVLNNLAYVQNKQGKHCFALFSIRQALSLEDKEVYRQTEDEIKGKIKGREIDCSLFEGEWELW